MADQTNIEWTDASWTPIRARWFAPTDDGGGRERVGWHCEHVSEGCRNCYAGAINDRLGTGLDFKPGNLFRLEKVGCHNGQAKIFLDETMLLQPLRWRRPRRICVCSMTDLFGYWVEDAWIDRVFAVAALASQHTYQVLTKRSARMRAYMADPGVKRRIVRAISSLKGFPPEHGDSAVLGREWPLPNVWLGVSAEDQRRADERVPDLLATPAAVRFVSAEPLLGPISFTDIPWPADRPRFPEGDDISDARSALHRIEGTRLDWIIVGGESGPGARPMHPAWARSIRDQCAAARVAFFFKQWGEYGTAAFKMSTGQPVYRQFRDFLHWVNKASTWVCGGICMDDAGRILQRGADFMRARDEETFPVTILHRVGKKAAGRLLDGVEHNGMPEVRHAG